MNKFILYNNGEYVLEHEAKVSFLDRGFQFSDGVYEVISIHLAHPVKLSEHLEGLTDLSLLSGWYHHFQVMKRIKISYVI